MKLIVHFIYSDLENTNKIITANIFAIRGLILADGYSDKAKKVYNCFRSIRVEYNSDCSLDILHDTYELMVIYNDSQYPYMLKFSSVNTNTNLQFHRNTYNNNIMEYDNNGLIITIYVDWGSFDNDSMYYNANTHNQSKILLKLDINAKFIDSKESELIIESKKKINFTEFIGGYVSTNGTIYIRPGMPYGYYKTQLSANTYYELIINNVKLASDAIPAFLTNINLVDGLTLSNSTKLYSIDFNGESFAYKSYRVIFKTNDNTFLYQYQQDGNGEGIELYEILSYNTIPNYVANNLPLIIKNQIISVNMPGYPFTSNIEKRNVYYGLKCFPVSSNKKYTINAKSSIYADTGYLYFISNENMEIYDSAALNSSIDIDLILPVQSGSTLPFTYDLTDYEYIAEQDGYIGVVLQNLDSDFAIVYSNDLYDGDINQYTDLKISKAISTANTNRMIVPPYNMNIICSGSSVTWGNGSIDGSMVGELDNLIKMNCVILLWLKI